MAIIRSILVPVDPSPCSAAALELALSLAGELGATVETLHVREAEGASGGSGARLAPEELERAERRVAEVISAAGERLPGRVKHTAEDGDPVRRILELAAARRPDLIVMGTHGRIGRLHMLVGSVAEGVVRSAPCPVLTVRVPDGAQSFAERIHDRAAS